MKIETCDLGQPRTCGLKRRYLQRKDLLAFGRKVETKQENNRARRTYLHATGMGEEAVLSTLHMTHDLDLR